MQEHRQKYVWDFWIIFFIIISIFYMGCTSGKPFQYREEVARQMSLALQQKDVYNQMKLNDIDSIRNFLNTNSNRMTCEEKFQVNVDLYNEVTKRV